MNERVRMVRKHESIKLTQQAFAESLGLAKSTYEKIEYGSGVLTDRTIRDICRIYNVNEDWLRTGAGEMFKPRTKEQKIYDFVGEALDDADDDTRKLVLYGLSTLDEKDWPVLRDIIKKAAELFKEGI